MRKDFAALIWKDLEGNARAFALLLAMVSGMGILGPIARAGVAPRSANLVFLTSINLVAMLAVAQWVFATEKQRKTITILKCLPVSARTIVGAKFAVAAVVGEIIFAASVLSIELAVWRQGGFTITDPLSDLFLINLVLLALLFLLCAMMVAFEPRTAMMLPFGGMLVLLFAWMGVKKHLLAWTAFREMVFRRSYEIPLVAFLSDDFTGIFLRGAELREKRALGARC